MEESDSADQPTLQDTLQLETYSDSLAGGVSEVHFGADSVIFYTDTKDVLLLHNGYVTYGEMTVYADSIRFSTSDRMLSAYKGAKLISSGDSLIGQTLHYGVESHKGVMEQGRTQIQEGYFSGQGVWLVEENVIHITRGYYTTCERYPPHYDFYGSQLKVILNDMVIAKPILLRIGKIPVLAAPFWYLPIGNDRKSGLLPFKFGRSDDDGWFAKEIRYYWVTNDYSEVLFGLDIMTYKGFRPGVNFNWLYGPSGAEYLSGGCYVNYINEIDTRHRRWTFGLNNTSLIPDGTKLFANINFSSDQYYVLDYMDDQDSLTQVLDLTRRTRSDVSISRKLLGRSASLSVSREDNLETGEYDMTLPKFNFSWPTASLWDFFTINFSSFSVTNTYNHDLSVIVDTLGDTTTSFADTRTTSFSQPLSMSWSYSLLGAYRFNQSWNAGQYLTWTQDSLIRDASYSLTNSFSTTLSRIFGIYILGMNGMLHSIDPSISYSITPAKQVIHPWVVYPRFDTTLAGHRVNLSIAQSFQAKFRSSSDSTKFKKQNLLNLSTGIGYNLLTDSLTPLTAGIDLPHGLPVTAGFDITYNLYTDDFTLNTSASAQLDKLIFPLFGWRKKGFAKDTIPWDSLGIEYGDTATYDSIMKAQPPDSVVLAEDMLYHPHEERETFVEAFSQSKIYLEDQWKAATDSLGELTGVDHMVSTRMQLFFPYAFEVNMSVSTNLSEPKSAWQDYVANYNLSIVKGLHCWEAVFELSPGTGTSLTLDNLEWDLYVRIKALPEIRFGEGMFERLGQ